MSATEYGRIGHKQCWPTYEIGLDRYRAGTRYPIPDSIGRIYTDTDSDTGLYNFFVLKMQFCAGIGVCKLCMYGMRGICAKNAENTV